MKPYSITFKINDLPASVNTFLSKGWRARWVHSKKWQMLVDVAIMKSGGNPPQPLKKSKIEMIRHSCRKLDKDNLYGSFKPVLDALKSQSERKETAKRDPRPFIPRVIVDDNEEAISLECTQVTAPRGKGFITVTVEEVE